MLTVYYVCKLPVIKAGELAYKVTVACNRHTVGSCFENIGIADYNIGTF